MASIPVMRCDNCYGTIHRDGIRFQCPECGALSTAYGGLFTHDADKEKAVRLRKERLALAKQGKYRI